MREREEVREKKGGGEGGVLREKDLNIFVRKTARITTRIFAARKDLEWKSN